MKMLDQECVIDRELPDYPELIGGADAYAARDAECAVPVPAVPLTESQIRDFQDLMIKSDALLGLGQIDDARRVRQLAAGIVFTGAPSGC